MNFLQSDHHCLFEHLGSTIAWHPSGESFAVSSVEGEIGLQFYGSNPKKSILLTKENKGDISVLAFSLDGKFLAAGGMGGWVWIWAIDLDWNVELLECCEFRTAWIDRLTWHPSHSLLAIAAGKTVQIWDGKTRKFQQSLEFAPSSVLDLAWDVTGDRLAASGNLAVKIWRMGDWDEAPIVLELEAASSAIGWSLDGQYLAVGTSDRTVIVVEAEDKMTMDEAWVMRGFPAKISALAWSLGPVNHDSQPTLAVVCAEGVVLWDWDDETEGWTGEVAVMHTHRIGAIAWSPWGLTIAGSQLLLLLNGDGDFESEERDWFAIDWHPRRPVMLGINDSALSTMELNFP